MAKRRRRMKEEDGGREGRRRKSIECLRTTTDLNVLNLKTENDGPDKTESECLVSIGDILGADILQIHLGFEIFQATIHVLHFLYSIHEEERGEGVAKGKKIV